MEITYGAILGLHIVAFMWNIAWVIISDFVGFLWLVGKIERVNKKFLNLTHWFIWVGLGVSILTGVYLFMDASEYLLTVPAFWTKIILVIALVINSFFISRHINLAETKLFSETTSSERKHLFISAAVSVVGWVGVVVAAGQLGL